MCDFRKPPKQIIDLATGKTIDVEYRGVIHLPAPKDTVPGMYHIAATGSYYSYYDGDRWYRNGNEKQFVFEEGDDNCFHLLTDLASL